MIDVGVERHKTSRSFAQVPSDGGHLQQFSSVLPGLLESWVGQRCFLRFYPTTFRVYALSLIAAANEEAHLRYAASLNQAGHQEKAHHEFRRIVKGLNHAWFHEQGGSAVPKVARPVARADGKYGTAHVHPRRQTGQRGDNG